MTNPRREECSVGFRDTENVKKCGCQHVATSLFVRTPHGIQSVARLALLEHRVLGGQPRVFVGVHQPTGVTVSPAHQVGSTCRERCTPNTALLFERWWASRDFRQRYNRMVGGVGSVDNGGPHRPETNRGGEQVALHFLSRSM